VRGRNAQKWRRIGPTPSSEVVKNGSFESILRVLTKKTEIYYLRYLEDLFVDSDEVAVKLSKCTTENHFSPPCESQIFFLNPAPGSPT
jgi:hypothetical protein